MIITKQADNVNNCKYSIYNFQKARDALYFIFKKYDNKKILIPAYIGYSSKEGSGVFDPIIRSKVNYDFYRLTINLEIDYDILDLLIEKNPNSILLIIHYFGFKDKLLNKIKQKALDNNVLIIEDFAHGLFTFFSKPEVNFDYAVFSLHKMLPFKSGGLLLSKDKLICDNILKYNYFEYNFNSISEKRNKNFEIIYDGILDINGISILRDNSYEGVPQTFPILLPSREIRDYLYFEMNDLGYGVVSLYHELIGEIDKDNFLIENCVSDRILNLPLHQDAKADQIKEMISSLSYILNNKIGVK